MQILFSSGCTVVPNFKIMITKYAVKAGFLQMLDVKIAAIDMVLHELFEAARNETKSTAGDKHETARAHVQIAQKQAADQRAILQNNRALLLKIDASIVPVDVRLGSLVQTKTNYFFISTGVGKIILENATVYAIALQAPIGLVLQGLKKGSSYTFNGKADQILAIF